MRTRGHARHLWGILGAIAIAIMIVGPAVARAPYPEPPPDFADPNDPLSEMFSPRGGQSDRPLLVIFAEFNDLTFDDTNPPSIDAAHLHERFFGGFPSIAGYFDATSNGELQITPAPETDTANNGAVNDGIVSVSIDEDKGDFLSRGREAEQAILLEAADPYVDYSQFDDDGSGDITQDELLMVRQDVDDLPLPDGCATARRPDPVTLDGVQLGSSNKDTFGTDDLIGVDAGTATNFMTIAHEVGHAAFGMPDTYFWENSAQFDLGVGTCGSPDNRLFHSSAWQAMHLGWVEPTVVTESGYYDVPRSPAGSSFILYDPAKSTDDFFVVENRARIAGTYEQGASDTGLVVWRLDESVYHPTGGGVPEGEEGFISLIRPSTGSHAWDPSFNQSDPERTMEGITWRDGTASNLAIRAISPAADVMRVYFDVRGPGILVDPITRDSFGNPITYDVTPDESNAIRVPVMNTGEASDTFRFYFDDLPTGWTSTADELTLDAGQEADSFPELIPAPDAATGVHQVTVVGESTSDPSVSERATVNVNVVLDLTGITYTGETYVPIGEPAGFSANVVNTSDGNAPIEGVEVTFELSGPGGSLTATGTTDASGNATADPIIDLPPGDYDLWVSTERFGKHAPGGTGADFRVPTAAERVGDLQDDVIGAGLHHGIENSLLSNLEQALSHLDAEQTVPACNVLNAFSNHVEAQSGKHIPDGTAESFLSDVEGIRDQLGC